MSGSALEPIDVPTIRPPGVTKRQWRLAALLPRCETAYEALKAAGYANSTARKQTALISGGLGVARATDAIAKRQADRARGLIGYGQDGLAQTNLKDIDPYQRAVISLKSIELGTTLGENIEQTGSATEWKRRVARVHHLTAWLTALRLASPPSMQAAAAERHARRQQQRMGY